MKGSKCSSDNGTLTLVFDIRFSIKCILQSENHAVFKFNKGLPSNVLYCAVLLIQIIILNECLQSPFHLYRALYLDGSRGQKSQII